MTTQFADFEFDKNILGKRLTISLTNANIAEHLIINKLVKHIVSALNELEVDNFISETMRKIYAKKSDNK